MIRLIFRLGLACLLFISTSASAYCWKEAADPYRSYGVNEALLKVIAKQESGWNPSAMNKNTNGTWDIGFMQINEQHLKRLSRFGITRATLKQDACVNLKTGAWILAEALNHYRNDKDAFWKGIGAYNAGYIEKIKSPLNAEKLKARRNQYAWQIYRKMMSMSRGNA